MNTNELLTLLENQVDGFNRDGPNGLLTFVNIAIGILARTPSEQHIVFDASTGRLPILNTKNNIFKYDAPTNCWQIAGILVEANISSNLIDYSNLISDYNYSNNQRSGVKHLDRIVITGIEYSRVPYVRQYDATDSELARVLFTENPGDTEDIYRWWYYRNPTQVLSDTMPLPIPPPYDYLYLYPATVRLIQGQKSGDFLNAHNDVLIIAKKYNKEMNKGEQGEDLEACSRGF